MNASENVIYRHAATSLDLLISGALHKLVAELPEGALPDAQLRRLLSRLHAEIDDWAESVDAVAMLPSDISVSINGPRTPYNVTSAIIDLIEELDTLVGTDDPSFKRIEDCIKLKRAQESGADDLRRKGPQKANLLITSWVVPNHTTESEFDTMARECGAQTVSFEKIGDSKIALVTGTPAVINALTADLGYGPVD